MRAYLENFVNRLWYQKKTASFFLIPFSWLFAFIIFLRKKAYQTGFFSSYRSTLKVIVVGNITVGGTGKTPVVIELLDYLIAQGQSPVVISRGYGRQSKVLIEVTALTPAALCGDEPLLIFQATGVPVVVANTRVAAVRYCEVHYPQSLVVCDDGLQHYALARDIEIAVIDGLRGVGNARLLPAGPLREPLSRLTRVDFRVVNGGVWPGAFCMQLVPQRVLHLPSQAVMDFSALSAMGSWLALTAIGNPQRFFASVQALGLHAEQRAFPDHYFFKAEDLAPFQDRLIMVTAKDAVKLREFSCMNIYVLEVRAVLPLDFYTAISTKLSHL